MTVKEFKELIAKAEKERIKKKWKLKKYQILILQSTKHKRM